MWLKDEIFDLSYAKHLEQIKKNQRKVKAMHICITCRKVPAQEGRIRCAKCAEMVNDYNHSRYKRLKAEGLCVTCATAPAREGAVKCRECAIKDSEKYFRRKEAKNENNKSV